MSRFERIEVEISKLTSLHSDIQRSRRHLISRFYPSKRSSSPRRIKVSIGYYYPECAPTAYVYPYDDIIGNIDINHIYSDGKICYMHENEWNSRLHNLAFVFSQSKLIVDKAVSRRSQSAPPWALPGGV